MIDQAFLIEQAWTIGKILVVILPLLGACALLTLLERRIIAFIQLRPGPNRLGFFGLLQPLADAIKLMTKEVVYPTQSNRYLFIMAPIIAFVPALVAWSVIPFSNDWVIADIDGGILFILAVTSLGAYGIITAGWSSNSKYAFYGAMRSAAQVISYEIAMSFAMVGVIMRAGSLNLKTIVTQQLGGISHWNIWTLFPLFMVYWISAIAETNRAPFDVAEGESEIVAGFHVEYSGMGFALFFLGEYANMILISVLASIMFLGGWDPLFAGVPYLSNWLAWVPSPIWLLLKSSLFIFMYLWFRATFPRYRYDQLMQLGWKVLIPVAIFWLVVTTIMIKLGVWA